jgi:hypothetical protein
MVAVPSAFLYVLLIIPFVIPISVLCWIRFRKPPRGVERLKDDDESVVGDDGNWRILLLGEKVERNKGNTIQLAELDGNRTKRKSPQELGGTDARRELDSLPLAELPAVAIRNKSDKRKTRLEGLEVKRSSGILRQYEMR